MIDITPEMLAAGVREIKSGRESDARPDEIARAVFIEMMRAYVFIEMMRAYDARSDRVDPAEVDSPLRI
jgi:hypothetical protein